MIIKLIPNYIPHKKPNRPNFNKWKNYFHEDLEMLYYNILNIIKKRHGYINLNFNQFCIFLLDNMIMVAYAVFNAV